ncbi:MAG: amidase [Actinomycetota bacterium]|nr:amidase [Actinomycetota bacterium]
MRASAAAGAGAAELAAAISAGTLSAEEVVEGALARFHASADLRAIITICGDRALARARGGVSGRLAGVPLLVKDLLDTAGVRTTYASEIYRDHVPERSAAAVAALEAEGAIVVAKANADEFAWGVTGQNPHYGDVVNPLHAGRISGGSSAGNAAALAAGLVPLALGTDTGGSVRMPAAACGVVGLKPPLGAISVEGVYPLAASFDTVGPMARSVVDCALAYSVLTKTPVPSASVAGLRIGVLSRPPDITGAGDGPDRDGRAAVVTARLRSLGASVTEVELPVPAADTWPVFYAEAATAHASTFPSRRAEYGATVRAKLELASRVDGEELRRARVALEQWRSRAALEPEVDLIASPALGLSELPLVGVDELEIRLPFSAYTRPFSYLGWPAIAVGELQLAGRDASTMLAAALALERDGISR